MKLKMRKILILAAASSPMQAIEPPVEAQPVPPRNVPEERNADRPMLDAPKAVAVPEVAEDRPYIGVILHPVPEILSSHLKLAEGEGLVVGELIPGGPAAQAGLEVNDIITRVNGEVIGTSMEVREKVEKHGVGDQVKLEVIHDGERNEIPVTLGTAPDMMPGVPQEGLAFGGAGELEDFLGNLPEKHADLMRQAMEQRLQGLGQGGNGEAWQRDLLKRIERGMKGGGEGLDFGEFKAEASARLFDDQGSIEMKGVDGNKEVKVFDKSGDLVWEGPYDTEQDKAAVPDDIRERIDQVDLNMGFGGDGIRLKMGQQRFRPLDNDADLERFDTDE